MRHQQIFLAVVAVQLLILQSVPVHSTTTGEEDDEGIHRNWVRTIVRLGIIALSVVGTVSGDGEIVAHSNALMSAGGATINDFRVAASSGAHHHEVMPHHNPHHHPMLFDDAMVKTGASQEIQSFPIVTDPTDLTPEQAKEVDSIVSHAIVPDDVATDPIPDPSAPRGVEVSDLSPKDIVMAEIGAVFSSAAYKYNAKTESEKHDIEKFVRASLPNLRIEDTTIFDQGETMMFFVRFHDPQTNALSGALVFRGTNNLGNWRDNFQSILMTDDRTTSRGLFGAYKKLRRNVKNVIRGAIAKKADAVSSVDRLMALRGGGSGGIDPGLKDQIADLPGGLYVYGHSLGGAMATYAAEDIAQYMQRRFPESPVDRNWLQVMTYGQPREFTDIHQSSQHEDSVQYRKIRFVVEGDPIPSLPFIDGLNPGGPYVGDEAPENGEFILQVPRFTHTGDTVFLHSRASQFRATAIEDDNFAASDAPGFLRNVLNPVRAHDIQHYIDAFDSIAHHHSTQQALTPSQQSLLAITGSATRDYRS